MKSTNPMTTTLLIFGFSVLIMPLLSACQTEEAGIKATPTSVYATVNGSPEKVTRAARDVLGKMNLKVNDSSATAQSGEVVATTVEQTQVTVSIDRYTDKTSTVTAKVGGLVKREPALAKKIINRIQRRLNEGGSSKDRDTQSQGNDRKRNGSSMR